MDWIKWLVPLIALVVWILVNLLRVPNDAAKAQNQPPKPPRPGGEGGFGEPVRQPMTDLDRFIQEAKRRRQEQEEPKKPFQQPIPKVSPRPPEKQASAIPVVRQIPSPERPNRPVSPPVPRVQPKPSPAIVRNVPTERSRQVHTPPRPESGKEEIIEAVPVEQADVDQAAGFSAPHQGAYNLERRAAKDTGTALTNQVLSMFRDPNAARVAFVLREILDRPKFPRGPRGS